MIWLSLGLAVAGISQPGTGAAQKLLVIDFPDGTRGGQGRIQGEGKLETVKGWISALPLLDAARRCGASYPMLSDNWSHHMYVISWSTAKDHAVVKCLKAALPHTFNAGIAYPDTELGFTKPDPSEFRQFEMGAAPSLKEVK